MGEVCWFKFFEYIYLLNLKSFLNPFEPINALDGINATKQGYTRTSRAIRSWTSVSMAMHVCTIFV